MVLLFFITVTYGVTAVSLDVLSVAGGGADVTELVFSLELLLLVVSLLELSVLSGGSTLEVLSLEVLSLDVVSSLEVSSLDVISSLEVASLEVFSCELLFETVFSLEVLELALSLLEDGSSLTTEVVELVVVLLFCEVVAEGLRLLLDVEPLYQSFRSMPFSSIYRSIVTSSYITALINFAA